VCDDQAFPSDDKPVYEIFRFIWEPQSAEEPYGASGEGQGADIFLASDGGPVKRLTRLFFRGLMAVLIVTDPTPRETESAFKAL
jgi:hypothetical protein